MLCDICGKKEATVHLTEIIDDAMTELHLCEECAREKGAQVEQHFGLAELLAGLADFEVQADTDLGVKTKLKCPSCGMTYSDFRKIGRLGCGNCYQTFKKMLLPLLKRIHGSTQHVGRLPTAKSPKASKARSEIQDLKAKLQKAIQFEDFEEAAKLRDSIKEIEKKSEEKNNNKKG